MEKTIEIPFGAFDSELKGWEYTIPEGMEARIDGNKIILEPKENEDETIRKELIGFIQDEIDSINRLVSGDYDDRDADDIARQRWCEKVLAWLKKQGEQKSLSTEETELNSLAFLTELGYTCISPTKEKSNSWSEEDERIRYAICDTLDRTDERIMEYNSQLTHQRVKDWLKSLKERCTWKPSDEQMMTLEQ